LPFAFVQRAETHNQVSFLTDPLNWTLSRSLGRVSFWTNEKSSQLARVNRF